MDLVTIEAVELATVGHWEASTGPFDVDRALLEQLVEAHQAHVMRHPVIKLGHTDPRFDGQPAVGYVDNLRIDGDVLLGDFAGVPKAFADIAATAFPDRSVEIFYEFTDQAGKTWPAVLTAVALLGASAPAVSALTSWQGVADLYTAATVSGPRVQRISTTTAVPESSRRTTERDRAALIAAARATRRERVQTAALAALTKGRSA